MNGIPKLQVWTILFEVLIYLIFDILKTHGKQMKHKNIRSASTARVCISSLSCTSCVTLAKLFHFSKFFCKMSIIKYLLYGILIKLVNICKPTHAWKIIIVIHTLLSKNTWINYYGPEHSTEKKKKNNNPNFTFLRAQQCILSNQKEKIALSPILRWILWLLVIGYGRTTKYATTR